MVDGSNARLGLGHGKKLDINLYSQDKEETGEEEIGKIEVEKNSIIRDEVFRQSMLRISSIFLWTLSLILLLALSSFIWHFVAPTPLHFLSEQQAHSIQTFLLSSALTTLALLALSKLIARYK